VGGFVDLLFLVTPYRHVGSVGFSCGLFFASPPMQPMFLPMHLLVAQKSDENHRFKSPYLLLENAWNHNLCS
jgi:hypothetical protein